MEIQCLRRNIFKYIWVRHNNGRFFDRTMNVVLSKNVIKWLFNLSIVVGMLDHCLSGGLSLQVLL